MANAQLCTYVGTTLINDYTYGVCAGPFLAGAGFYDTGDRR